MNKRESFKEYTVKHPKFRYELISRGMTGYALAALNLASRWAHEMELKMSEGDMLTKKLARESFEKVNNDAPKRARAMAHEFVMGIWR